MTTISPDTPASTLGQTQSIFARLRPRNVRVVDICRAYRVSFAVDVARFFDSDHIDAVVDESLGFLRFNGCGAGDSAFYAQLMRKRGGYRREKWEFNQVSNLLGDSERLLDIGCGRGDFAASAPQVRYAGIEFNPDAVADANRRQLDVRAIPLESVEPASFDAVTMFQVLEHVDDPVGFARLALSKLRCGGLLAIAVPNSAGFIGRTVNMPLNYPPHHLTWWDGPSLHALANLLQLKDAAVTAEPLTEEHFLNVAYSIYLPRTSEAFDFSVRNFIVTRTLRALFRMRTRTRQSIEFAEGHSLLLVGRKP